MHTRCEFRAVEMNENNFLEKCNLIESRQFLIYISNKQKLELRSSQLPLEFGINESRFHHHSNSGTGWFRRIPVVSTHAQNFRKTARDRNGSFSSIDRTVVNESVLLLNIHLAVTPDVVTTVIARRDILHH